MIRTGRSSSYGFWNCQIAVAFFLATLNGWADPTLPTLFSDHMVLQQGREIRIWGKATGSSADARIEGNTVVVSSRDVPQPVAVRYAWGDSPRGNLFNKDGLPASPFRTDDWPGITGGQ